MSRIIELSLPTKNHSGMPSAESAKVPGVICHLALRAPMTAQPSAAELALISGLLPELLGQLMTESAADSEE